MSYRCFAQFYDILTQNIPYRARGEYFHALFQRYGLPGNIVLDLACGTGSLTEALASLVSDEELNADYILPYAFDKRVRETVSKAVFDAAHRSGVARI